MSFVHAFFCADRKVAKSRVPRAGRCPERGCPAHAFLKEDYGLTTIFTLGNLLNEVGNT